MRSGRCLYVGAVVVALVIGLGLWNPMHVKADHDRDGVARFRVDPYWPKPLPVTVTNGVAHRWVQGEVAGTCVDSHNHVFTTNRGWQGGVVVGGVTFGNESGALVGQDATASSIPSPPIVAFDEDGRVVTSFGDATLFQPGDLTLPPGAEPGGAKVMPHGAHGCFVDYQDNVWVGGNADGVVQKYSHDGTLLLQIGQKGVCDGPTNNTNVTGGGANVFPTCGDAHDGNSSHTLLNEPADMAVDPDANEVYIADGYGNHRIVVFDATTGAFKRQWGSSCGHNELPGGGNPCPAGTFGATGGGHPHCVVLGNDGLVYVCDRPNNRIQIFTKSGTWQKTIYVLPPDPTNPKQAAILLAGTRACDMTFYPNVDYLAGKSPTHQKYIVDVDLGNDNVWLLDKASGAMLSGFGRCGLGPCPGHNAGEFAFAHTVSTDTHGNVYVAETITGRRMQKFVRVDDDDDHHGRDNDHH